MKYIIKYLSNSPISYTVIIINNLIFSNSVYRTQVEFNPFFPLHPGLGDFIYLYMMKGRLGSTRPNGGLRDKGPYSCSGKKEKGGKEKVCGSDPTFPSSAP